MSNNGNYQKYVVGRTFVKGTSYERINTGRRRKHEESPSQFQPMTGQELDKAYGYRQRAKREHLVRLADVNFVSGSCVFVTLTFKENLTDYNSAVKAFKLFTKSLRKRLDDLRYIATIETQERGAYHFHLLVNCENVQFALDNLSRYWHNGIADVTAVDDVKNAILYMSKDLIKQGRQHPLYNRRCYFLSQGLERCVEINSWNGPTAQMRDVEAMLQGRSPSKTSVVNSDKAGLTEYHDYYFTTEFYGTPVLAKLKSD